MNKLSVCMIVKNEESVLGACLSSIVSITDELIVVDTGSTDRTREIAGDHGAVIYNDPWKNDFSYSRNISLSHASQPWIMWIDADDRMAPDDCLRIQKIKSEFALDTAFGFRIRNTGGGQGTIFNQIRMFPNRAEIRFSYRIHEQVLPSIQKTGLRVAYTDVMVSHTGYESPEATIKKQERNLILLRQEVDEAQVDHPVVLFMYGGALYDLNKKQEAIPVYIRAYTAALEQKREKHIEEAVPLRLAQLGAELGDDALYTIWVAKAEEQNPNHIQLNFLKGRIAESGNDYYTARLNFEKVLSAEEKPGFIPVDFSSMKLQACTALAKIYGTVHPNKRRLLELLEMAKQIRSR
jgi:glycosyltransferase involved in cell wall biosynthesis